jgi:hypothetical protein
MSNVYIISHANDISSGPHRISKITFKEISHSDAKYKLHIQQKVQTYKCM